MQVQAPTMQNQNHPYQQRQPIQASTEVQAQVPNQSVPQHPILAQQQQQQPQPTHFIAHSHSSSTRPPAEAQAEAQLRAQSQAITQHMSVVAMQVPAQPMQPPPPQQQQQQQQQQSHLQTQAFSQPLPYAFPPQHQQQQQQQQHGLASIAVPNSAAPAPGSLTRYSPTHTPVIQQQQSLPAVVPYQASNVSYEQQQREQQHQQNYEATAGPTTSLLTQQQPDAVPQRIIPIAAPAQQQQQQQQQPPQLQYSQTIIASSPETLHLPPPEQLHTQQQQQYLAFPQHVHQQAYGQLQAQAQPQDTSNSIFAQPQVGAQHTVRHSYSPQQQQQQQQQLTQQNLSNSPDEPVTQDALDAHRTSYYRQTQM